MVSVTGTVGVAGAWLGGRPVHLGASNLAWAGPPWSLTFDEATTNSNGSYSLRGVMDREPECPWAYVYATFDLPPFGLRRYLAGDLQSVCDVAEVEFEVHFPVRRTNVMAQGRIFWSDGSAAQGVNVVLRYSTADTLAASRTDSNGKYGMGAAVLDAVCDADSEFAGSGYTWLRVSDDGGVTLGDSGPLVCGVNHVDLIAD